MTQLGGPMPRRTVPARPNVYTVLAVVAFLALTAATVFVWTKNIEMTQSDQPKEGSNPWYVVPQTQDQKSVSGAGGS